MSPRDEQGSTLSAQRAFVVHLSADGGSGRRRFRGRVEHLSSGQTTHFSSVRGLLTFFAAVLDAAGGTPTEQAPQSAGSGSLPRAARRRPPE